MLTVETHPQRKYIIDSIVSGTPLRTIAANLDPPMHYTSLQRYSARRVRPTIHRAIIAAKHAAHDNALPSHSDPNTITASAVKSATKMLQDAEVADPYLARIAKHRETIDAEIARVRSEKKPDPRGVASLIRTDLSGLELDARLTGRLDTAPAQTNIAMQIMVAMPRAIDDEQEASAEAALITCVAPVAGDVAIHVAAAPDPDIL